MEFNIPDWIKEKKDYFTDGQEWGRTEDETKEGNDEDKMEFDLYGTALNEL